VLKQRDSSIGFIRVHNRTGTEGIWDWESELTRAAGNGALVFRGRATHCGSWPSTDIMEGLLEQFLLWDIRVLLLLLLLC
jgi:hypothetical protein